MVGSERREALASARWSTPARARAARSCRDVISCYTSVKI
jgi:hypothetical protein